MRNNWSSALAEYTAALHFSEYVTDGGRETESEGETLHLERRKWERERASERRGPPHSHSCEA